MIAKVHGPFLLAIQVNEQGQCMKAVLQPTGNVELAKQVP